MCRLMMFAILAVCVATSLGWVDDPSINKADVVREGKEPFSNVGVAMVYRLWKEDGGTWVTSVTAEYDARAERLSRIFPWMTVQRDHNIRTLQKPLLRPGHNVCIDRNMLTFVPTEMCQPSRFTLREAEFLKLNSAGKLVALYGDE